MGYTFFSKQLVQKYMQEFKPKSVVDLGAQNDFSYPILPAPYISDFYYANGVEYGCIDLNGENGASTQDLSRVFKAPGGWQADLVCNFGTSEHVGCNGKFQWDALYNCWANMHNLLKIGGILICENPMTNNWPLHGFSYLETNFYHELCKVADYELLETGTQAAMGNENDGWNVWGVLKKTGPRFAHPDEFILLPIKQS